MNKLILSLCGAAALTVSASAFAGGDTSRGAELAKKYNCASCHGADFKTPIDPS
jgi:cytochrome c553